MILFNTKNPLQRLLALKMDFFIISKKKFNLNFSLNASALQRYGKSINYQSFSAYFSAFY